MTANSGFEPPKRRNGKQDLPSRAAPDTPPPRVRRSLEMRPPSVAAPLIAVIAHHLAAVTDFGHLPPAEVYTIRQVSTHLMVSLRTLRFYEQAGLSRPERDGSRRLYGREDVDRLTVIVVLREMEASLPEIKALMSAFDRPEATEAEVWGHVEGLLAELHRGNDLRIGQLKLLNERLGAMRRQLVA